MHENGDLIYPNNLTHKFNKFLRIHKLKKIRLHDLRHSCASIMIANGISMKQIQEWLGHASYTITADTYTHLDFTSKKQSASAIANALGSEQAPAVDEEQANMAAYNHMIQEMKSYGFTRVEDYLEYLQQPKTRIETDKSKKDYCM